jgi:hypothetical protein
MVLLPGGTREKRRVEVVIDTCATMNGAQNAGEQLITRGFQSQ